MLWNTERYDTSVIIPPTQRSCWGVYWFLSVRPSVCPSVAEGSKNISPWFSRFISDSITWDMLLENEGNFSEVINGTDIRPDSTHLSLYDILVQAPSRAGFCTGNWSSLSLPVQTCIMLWVCSYWETSAPHPVSSLWRLQFWLDPFHIYTSYQVTSEGVSCVKFLAKFANLTF